MLGGKVRVKGLDAKRRGVAGKPVSAHQRERSESPNVSVVDGASVTERELDCRVFPFAIRQTAGVDEQGAREAWLDDEMVAGAQVEHDKLRAAPAPRDGRSGGALRELSGRDLAQHIRSCDADSGDSRAAHLAV